jgi:hypothetical protein
MSLRSSHPSSWCGRLREHIMENPVKSQSSRDWEYHCRLWIRSAALARRTTWGRPHYWPAEECPRHLIPSCQRVNRHSHGQQLSIEGLFRAGPRFQAQTRHTTSKIVVTAFESRPMFSAPFSGRLRVAPPQYKESKTQKLDNLLWQEKNDST